MSSNITILPTSENVPVTLEYTEFILPFIPASWTPYAFPSGHVNKVEIGHDSNVSPKGSLVFLLHPIPKRLNIKSNALVIFKEPISFIFDTLPIPDIILPISLTTEKISLAISTSEKIELKIESNIHCTLSKKDRAELTTDIIAASIPENNASINDVSNIQTICLRIKLITSVNILPNIGTGELADIPIAFNILVTDCIKNDLIWFTNHHNALRIFSNWVSIRPFISIKVSVKVPIKSPSLDSPPRYSPLVMIVTLVPFLCLEELLYPVVLPLRFLIGILLSPPWPLLAIVNFPSEILVYPISSFPIFIIPLGGNFSVDSTGIVCSSESILAVSLVDKPLGTFLDWDNTVIISAIASLIVSDRVLSPAFLPSAIVVLGIDPDGLAVDSCAIAAASDVDVVSSWVCPNDAVLTPTVLESVPFSPIEFS